ncbi:MAG: DNA polymerase III subunit epsilon [Proteobacteria bacterium]|nr:DNA polymerase III subunit epsilon [Pseudomonadota bacterium]MBS0218659.1 DNA polymerase III subunit epsilon [Pseudomonadota bacterium]
MRQVVLDTETTGLEWKIGNRVVEIGCVELLERRPSGKTFHVYINPQREFESGAQEVTGLTLDFLADKPLFADIIDDFIAFIDGAELVIHNAAFDVGFLDHELSLAGDRYGRIEDHAGVLDTLALARQKYPGQRNSLDALCRRLGVDNSHRQLHGALLDAQLLAEAYLAMTSGQGEIGFDAGSDGAVEVVVPSWMPTGDAGVRPRVTVSAADIDAHEARMAAIAKKAKDGRVLWPR